MFWNKKLFKLVTLAFLATYSQAQGSGEIAGEIALDVALQPTDTHEEEVVQAVKEKSLSPELASFSSADKLEALLFCQSELRQAVENSPQRLFIESFTTKAQEEEALAQAHLKLPKGTEEELEKLCQEELLKSATKSSIALQKSYEMSIRSIRQANPEASKLSAGEQLKTKQLCQDLRTHRANNGNGLCSISQALFGPRGIAPLRTAAGQVAAATSLANPLTDKAALQARKEIIERLVNNPELLSALENKLIRFKEAQEKSYDLLLNPNKPEPFAKEEELKTALTFAPKSLGEVIKHSANVGRLGAEKNQWAREVKSKTFDPQEWAAIHGEIIKPVVEPKLVSLKNDLIRIQIFFALALSIGWMMTEEGRESLVRNKDYCGSTPMLDATIKLLEKFVSAAGKDVLNSFLIILAIVGLTHFFPKLQERLPQLSLSSLDKMIKLNKSKLINTNLALTFVSPTTVDVPLFTPYLTALKVMFSVVCYFALYLKTGIDPSCTAKIIRCKLSFLYWPLLKLSTTNLTSTAFSQTPQELCNMLPAAQNFLEFFARNEGSNFESWPNFMREANKTLQAYKEFSQKALFGEAEPAYAEPVPAAPSKILALLKKMGKAFYHGSTKFKITSSFFLALGAYFLYCAFIKPLISDSKLAYRKGVTLGQARELFCHMQKMILTGKGCERLLFGTSPEFDYLMDEKGPENSFGYALWPMLKGATFSNPKNKSPLYNYGAVIACSQYLFNGISSTQDQTVLSENEINIDELTAAMQKVGEADLCCSLAQLVTKTQGDKNRFCIAQFLDQKEASLVGRGIWHPLFDRETTVCNDLEIGGKQGKRVQGVLVTGGNGTGKTVAITAATIAALLAQALGVACATEFTITPFDKFVTHMNTVDDPAKKQSLFRAQINQIAQLAFEIIQDAKNGKLTIVALDESASGTKARYAAALLGGIIKQLLAGKSNYVMLFATHLEHLASISEEISSGKIVPFKMVCNLDKEGHFVSPRFEIASGASPVDSAFVVAQEEFSEYFGPEAVQEIMTACKDVFKMVPA